MQTPLEFQQLFEGGEGVIGYGSFQPTTSVLGCLAELVSTIRDTSNPP